MIEIPVYNMNGEQVGSEKLDPELLGGRVRAALLKQAVIAYRNNSRQGTVQTKSRGMVDGSTRKLYRQKGTGNARAGNLRTPVRVGGGHAFAKINRDFTHKLPQQMRQLARNSAVLAKAKAGTAVIIKDLKMTAPKTKQLSGLLKAMKAERGGLLAVTNEDPNIRMSGRNIPNFNVKLVWEANAYDILRARMLIFTAEAFGALKSDPQTAGRPAKA